MMRQLIAILALGTLLFTGMASADTDQRSVVTKPRPVADAAEFRPHLGLIMGVSQPEGSGTTNGDLGVDFGYQAYIPFSVGAEYIHSRIDDGSSQASNRDTVWLKTTYNLGGTIPVIKESYFGLAVGAAFRSDGTSPAIAPLVGFDIPVEKFDRGFLSLGANARYAIVADGQLDTFSVGGVVKYWF